MRSTFDQRESSEIILRLPQVKFRSGLSRSSIYAYIKQGLWPKPIKLGLRSVGWSANEVAEINSARIAGKSNEEIQQLVIKIEFNRKKHICLVGK